MNVSSTGNGAPRIRSINVRANLLAEWTIDQIRFRAESARYFIGIACCVALMAGAIPAIEGSRRTEAAAVQKQEAELKSLKADLAAATAANKAAEPKLASAELRAQTSAYFNRMVGEIYDVLDAAKSGMAFSSARIDVRGAEIVIDCRAEAENYDVAAAFAEQAGRTPNKVSTLASTRPNPLLGPSGVSFEYIKRVNTQ